MSPSIVSNRWVISQLISPLRSIFTSFFLLLNVYFKRIDSFAELWFNVCISGLITRGSVNRHLWKFFFICLLFFSDIHRKRVIRWAESMCHESVATKFEAIWFKLNYQFASLEKKEIIFNLGALNLDTKFCRIETNDIIGHMRTVKLLLMHIIWDRKKLYRIT